MARPKEFNPERALAKAMSVFWRLGYEKASLDLLMKEMGIARQSLYDTFGDKRALYLKALKYYRDETNAGLRQVFESAPRVRDGFARLLFEISSESREQHARGCLLLSANLSRDMGDAVIADFLRDNQATVQSIFVEALRHAQERGELSRTQDPVALGRFFVVTIQGMRAMARVKSDRKALQQVARVALAVFDEGVQRVEESGGTSVNLRGRGRKTSSRSLARSLGAHS
jgi:TetR/AcrR family transcriptional regulator, transcriptional repressor for nem operon